ncbi:MAG: exopolysaccharide biosynthesis polyprenyl glycosylphosphotransferase [Winogradskyella sp.]|nr:exopolysaccharide biosynthesis polyprenyl glycosylphosphotransferase [Winogradskyella sp.]
MVSNKRNKLWLIWFVPIVIDICVVSFFGLKYLDFGTEKVYFFNVDYLNNKEFLFVAFTAVSWIISTYFIKFYKIDRYTTDFKILSLLLKQFLLFTLIVYTFIGIFRSVDIQATVTLKYLIISFSIIGVIKLFVQYINRKSAIFLKDNLKEVIIVGNGEGAKELEQLFHSKKELGFKLLNVYNKTNSNHHVSESLRFIEQHVDLDEIYCAIDELAEEEINEFVRLASLNNIQLKFIPEANKHHTKRLIIDYYNYQPILSIKQAALNNEVNQFIKRIFDVVFSVFIIVFVLSWVTIILGLLIKLESRGSVFYKHTRHGINYKPFTCYKFRSLRNVKFPISEQVIEDDTRVTRIGRIIRRTSIDELPQFVNVLLGDMSVVGPRPHMLPYTSAYAKKIDKYEFAYRHMVKPGITGLAQIKGFRGEIKNDEDIINRVKYDIFYIENWSLLLDIKIIVQTFFNIVTGEDKAY